MTPPDDAGHSDAAARHVTERVARRSYGKLVALLSARTRDVAGAEDALSQAFAEALAEWPRSGAPDNPEAWLMAVAKRRRIDAIRRGVSAQAAAPHLEMLAREIEDAAAMDDDIPDARLRLMFACAHPAIEESIRAPLILQTILGFGAAEIASAFLVAPAAMSQRLTRAKTRIRQAGVPFRMPEKQELPERLDAVLAAIYAAFAEGWVDAAGADARRRNLAQEGIWLGRLVASLLPQEPEALGLLALMLHAEARHAARRDAQGEYVPLAAQDTTLWDHAAIREAEHLIHAASRMSRLGRYQLEAAVQSAHAVRRLSGKADWAAIERLYDALLAFTGSPVVAINRAAAIAETRGPAAALAALDAISGDARLAEFQSFWAARAEFLAKANQPTAAWQAYERAIGLESDPAARRFLQARQDGLAVH